MSAAPRRFSVRLPHTLRASLLAQAAAESIDPSVLIVRAVKADLMRPGAKDHRQKRPAASHDKKP